MDDDQIKLLFQAFDSDNSGLVSAHEYLLYSLREAMTHTKSRMVDLFKQCKGPHPRGTSPSHAPTYARLPYPYDRGSLCMLSGAARVWLRG